jgi:transcriptional regulatory protein RtcR
VGSNFQLTAGTNRDWFEQVRAGLFREDLLARINLWTYELPSLRNRLEDLEPNIEHELQQFTIKAGHKVSFNKAAREDYLAFARSAQALWRANFRDLNSSITRMATLATGGRITQEIVGEEVLRLSRAWSKFGTAASDTRWDLGKLLPAETLGQMDLFDRLQLAQVVAVCAECRSLAEAGRMLFSQSRLHKTSVNDTHRLKQYLQRFGLEFNALLARAEE